MSVHCKTLSHAESKSPESWAGTRLYARKPFIWLTVSYDSWIGTEKRALKRVYIMAPDEFMEWVPASVAARLRQGHRERLPGIPRRPIAIFIAQETPKMPPSTKGATLFSLALILSIRYRICKLDFAAKSHSSLHKFLIWRRTVPVHHVWWRIIRIALFQFFHWFALLLDAAELQCHSVCIEDNRIARTSIGRRGSRPRLRRLAGRSPCP
jgi:hypothetical protein